MDEEEIEVLDVVPPKKKQRKGPYVIAILLALSLIVTVTITSYAFFTGSITNSDTINNTVVTTTSLDVEFTDGPTVGLENALPGSYVEKTFKIENKGSGDTTYDVYMSDLINDFADKSDLKYTLSSADGGYVVSTSVQVPSRSSKIVESHLIRAGETHNYTLRIDFLETNDNQDDNKGKTFSTIIRVNDVQDATPNYTIVSGDLDTVGSVVKIVDEEFYVIGQGDENHVKLLSKWNLNVGDNPYVAENFLQDSNARGFRSDSGTTYGNVVYSGTNYWYDATTNKTKEEYGSITYNASVYRFEDNEGNVVYPYVYTNKIESGNYIASIADYVDRYVTYLSNQDVSVTGRLLNHTEMVELGCTSTGFCSTNGGSSPNWIYQTSYWLGSADSNTYLWGIKTNGNAGYFNYNSSSELGVRPVIILEK